MAAALDLFAERNFASVTIKDIAEAAEVNTALIYYYFENKEDLFRATIENAVQQAFANFRELQQRQDNPAKTINGWLDNHIHLYDRIHKLVKISLDYAGSPNRVPSIDRSIKRFYDEERRMLSESIQLGISRGQFQSADPDRLAQFISTCLDGLMVRSVILRGFDLKSAVEQLRQIIWKILRPSHAPRA